jgi:uncharacterized protein
VDVYLDTSVVVSVMLPDAHSLRAKAWLAANTPDVVMSSFTLLEFSSVISKFCRFGQISSLDAGRLLQTFDLWCATRKRIVSIENADLVLANSYVRRFETSLRAPDALHLAVASRFNIPMDTFDLGLAKAGRLLGCAIIEP